MEKTPPTLFSLCALALTLVFALAACTTAPPPALTGITWQWVEFTSANETIFVTRPQNFTLTLVADGSLSLQAECNSGGGSYTLSGQHITFNDMMTTLMYCGDDSQDSLFLNLLSQVTSYVLEEGVLFLELPGDGGSMQFRPGS
jgi:heat shock protein HslJ